MSFPEDFLEIVTEALEHTDELEDAVTWKKSKWDTPALVPVNDNNRVDEEKFKRFSKLLNFLVLGIFGVDEEGRGRGQLVKAYLKDTTRDDTVMPLFKIPTISWRETSLRKLVETRELSELNAGVAAKQVDHLDRQINYLLKEQFKREDFKDRAENCEKCDGQGYIVYSKEEYEKLRRRASNDLGSPLYLRIASNLNTLYDIPYRGVACNTCQPDEKIL